MCPDKTEVLHYSVKPIYCREIEKKQGERYAIVYGVVVDPDELDADTGNKLNSEDLEYTAHYFLSHYKEIRTPEGCAIVESYIVPVKDAKIGPYPVNQGSWVMAFEITDVVLMKEITNREFEGIEITLSIPFRGINARGMLDPLNEKSKKVDMLETNETNLLSKFGIDTKQIDDYQVLCLPENINEAKSIEELYDTKEGLKLCEQFKQAGLATGNSIDLKIHRTDYIRKSGIDLWLGTILILQSFVLPLVATIIAHRINQWLDESKESKQAKDEPSLLAPKVHLTLNVWQGNNFTTIVNGGNANAVVKQLEEVDGQSQQHDNQT
jgi:hypothetical protein